MAQKNYIISEEVAQATLRYLVSRPFNEVHQLVGAFQMLEVASLPELVEDSKEVEGSKEKLVPKPTGRAAKKN